MVVSGTCNISQHSPSATGHFPSCTFPQSTQHDVEMLDGILKSGEGVTAVLCLLLSVTVGKGGMRNADKREIRSTRVREDQAER